MTVFRGWPCVHTGCPTNFVKTAPLILVALIQPREPEPSGQPLIVLNAHCAVGLVCALRTCRHVDVLGHLGMQILRACGGPRSSLQPPFRPSGPLSNTTFGNRLGHKADLYKVGSPLHPTTAQNTA
jgi:hypothetical protein